MRNKKLSPREVSDYIRKRFPDYTGERMNPHTILQTVRAWAFVSKPDDNEAFRKAKRDLVRAVENILPFL